jgi:Zn-dependent protease with chaperone function
MTSTTSTGRCPVAFSGQIDPTAISGTYRLALVLVMVAMILVPLLYISLIAAVAWALVWHLSANTWILSGTGGSQWRLLMYLTPAVVGGVLLFFMVKPILARRPRQAPPVQVSESDQPELHALIREICRQVRAPIPSRVRVDCQVNASASLEGGAAGIFRRDVTLTIGLPLVTGLSVRELSGVLAHEFGHFAQGGGMRMTTLIRGINFWLVRVVHERDAWDLKLEEWSKEGDARVMIPLALARLSVWASRQALAGLTLAGHSVSCYMLRQMEFDADSYEIKIAGSDAFTRTVVRLRELSAGSQVAYSQLGQALQNRAVPADLPLLFAEHSRRLPDGIRDQVRKTPEERTGMLDTHPADGDRVAAAKALAASGVLVGGDEPATSLFRDFDSLSAAVTRHHYEQDLGITLDEIRMTTTDEALRQHQESEQKEAAAEAFFNHRVSVTRPLRLPIEEVETLATEALRRAADEAQSAATQSSTKQDDYRRFEHLQHRRDLAFCAEQLFVAGMRTVDAEQFSLAEPTLAGAQSIQSWAVQEQAAIGPQLDAFEALSARRLACGLMLVADQHEPAGARRTSMLAFNALGATIPFVVEARRSAMAIHFLEAATPALGTSPHLRQQLDGLSQAIERCRAQAFTLFSNAPPPSGEPEIGEAWSRLLSNAAALPPVEFLQRLLELYWAFLLRLVRIAADADGSSRTAAPGTDDNHASASA